MNEEIILKMVQPYLKDNSLSYGEFDRIFEMLSLREQYGVLEILNQNKIELRDDDGKDEDACRGESVVDEDFEILYEDSVFSGEEEYLGNDTQDKYSRYPEVKKDIKLSNEILCVMIQQGNAQAKQDLCIRNRRLVEKIANAYYQFAGNDLAFDDLRQAGMMGMLNAAEKFDPDRGNAFLTYAVWWMKQAVIREIYDHGFTIRIPVHMMEMIHKVNALDRSLSMTVIGYRDRLIKIAEELGTTEETIEQCLAVQNSFLNTSSLDVPVGEAQDFVMLDLISDETVPSVEDEVCTNIMREKVVDALQILTKREQEVLDLRFGLTDGRERTLEDVGNILGVTRERIRQIEQKAFRKIRRPGYQSNLRDFLY